MPPGDYNFDFNAYASTPAVPPFIDGIANLQPIQPSPAFPQNGAQRGFGLPPQTGEKRPAEDRIPSRHTGFEEDSRVAAEEDKRRRNTAASARFRVKKKAREQALEKSQKELADKVSTLEGRIQTLETENKWLRELVTDKNGGSEKAVTAFLEEQRNKTDAGKPKANADKAD